MAVSRPRLSVVCPAFQEEDVLPIFHAELSRALAPLADEFQAEVVYVDDGSTDGTLAVLRRLAASDPRVRYLSFSRNFGHQAAVTAGLDRAAGRAVVVMDGDLQDPPELLGQLVARWREGFEVVYAVRAKRKEGPLKRLGYFAFYRLLRAVSDLDIPLDSGDFCLMDRAVVDVLNHLPERQRFVRGLRTFVGFRQVGLTYDRGARAAGQPKYTFGKLVGLAVDGLVSFSGSPLRLVTYLGFAAVGLAVLLSAWVVADAVSNQSTPRGWASTMVAVLFMGAVQLVGLGIIGEYIRRIFLEVKARPTYIAREARPPAPTGATSGD